MSTPRFSVVIPTRQRHETLAYCLQSCLAQQFDDFEIVVADNGSSAETRKVVMAPQSDKIRCVRSDQPLAMMDNYELATAHATGEFLLLIGDDDGLLPNALAEMDRLLQVSHAQVVRCATANYYWPSLPMPELANSLTIPLGRGLQRCRSLPTMASVARFEQGHDALPMIYNSFVHRDLVAKLKAARGRVFNAVAPDVYSGFAIAWLAGEFLATESPLIIRGASGKATGAGSYLAKGKSEAAVEFEAMNRQKAIYMHPSVPDVPLTPAIIADAFMRARDGFFAGTTRLALDQAAMVRSCLQVLAQRDDPPQIREEYLTAIEAAVAHDGRTLRTIRAARKQWHPAAPGKNIPRYKPAYSQGSLIVDAPSFGVTDVTAPPSWLRSSWTIAIFSGTGRRPISGAGGSPRPGANSSRFSGNGAPPSCGT